MNQDLILQVGDAIRQKRQQRKITLEQLAARAGVSKGLVSQIENNRTVPSLPVLFALIHALEESVKEFFEALKESPSASQVLIVRSQEQVPFQKEPVEGFTYRRIFTKSILSQTTDVVLLSLEPGAERQEQIRTEAFECKYILKGTVEYHIGGERYKLAAGDTLFFDGRIPHRLKNAGRTRTEMLVLYFF